VVRGGEGRRKNHLSISSVAKFFFISCVYLHAQREIPLSAPPIMKGWGGGGGGSREPDPRTEEGLVTLI